MTLIYDGITISYNAINKSDYPGGIDDPAFAKRILCEGDSWFSLGAIPSSNMLFPLKFAQKTLLYNLAKPGDTIRNMSSPKKNTAFAQLINDKKIAPIWDCIFISGGGNDFIDRIDHILCRPSDDAGKHMLDYINQIELTQVKIQIQAGYKAIAALRNQGDKQNKDTWIATHVYDYPTPRFAKSKILGLGVGGPWLYPAFKSNNIPDEFWISLTDYLFEWLATVLIELTTEIEKFHVITSTRETLVRAKLGTTGEDGDWLNEIHPTRKGYEKLASIVSAELDSILNR